MFKKFISSLLVVGIVAINFGFFTPNMAMAASLTAMSDTVSNLTTSALANHTIQFTTPTGVASGQTIILTFDNGTSIDSLLDYTDIDLSDDSTPITLAAAASGSTVGVVRTSATVITFTNGTTAIGAGSVINIKIGTHATEGVTGDKQITNGSVSTTTLRVSGTFTDTGVISMAIVSNGVVAVSAEVLASISFAVSANSINFGTLSSSAARYANATTGSATPVTAFTLSAGTNATTGYSVSVQGNTLTSGGNTIDALATNLVSAPGTEQFGLRLDPAGGSGTVTAPYAASGYAYTGTASTPAQVASHTGPSATTVYSATYLANIAALTQAGSYSTSHTYVATGNF